MHFLITFLLIFLLANVTTVSADMTGAKAIAGELTPVRVQLKWFHQFQFAGFYAALEQGYFKQAGLDVSLIEGGPKIDPTHAVIAGDAEFGIGNSTLLLDYNNGSPVVAVSAIFQHSPFIILARRDSDIRTVKDLEGHTLMSEEHAAELITYLKLAGVNIDKVEFIPHTGTISSLAKDDPSGIDAATAYMSIEPYLATKENIPYRIFNPRNLEIDFYADTLFTSQDYATNHSEKVVAMRDALARGWQYARTNQDEIISLIIQKYQTHRDFDRLALNNEAQVITQLLGAEIVDIGYMSTSRWEHIGEVFYTAGELPANYVLDGFLFKTDEALPVWVYQAMLVVSILVIIGIITSIYIVTLNRKLSKSLALVAEQSKQMEIANQSLRQLSTTDALTGIANRRCFDNVMNDEFLRAKRDREPLALLMIDVDFFKNYNDHYGHQAGDNCLIEIAHLFKYNLQRAGDFVARYGGEEFAVIVPHMNAEKAFELAKKICGDVTDLSIPHEKSSYRTVTVSIGVYSCIPEKLMLSETMLNNADIALYQAKKSGRNRVRAYAFEG